MRTVRETVLVEASPESVWDVLVDPYYIPKLYPDLINVKVDPPGRAVVGQKHTVGGRAGKRLIEFRTEVAALEPSKRYELRGRRGGGFEESSQVIELKEVKGGTEMKVEFFFKISEAYFGAMYDLLTLEQMAVRNIEVYIKNVKALSELKAVG